MWLTNSSIGKKVIMSVTGIALILFLTFHARMNVVALFIADAYNAICAFLGANWYAVVGTAALAALVALHFVFAFILTLQNRKARGSNRYAVSTKVNAGKVEWAAKNMFVLGLIVCLGMLLHLYNFWYNMMFAEIVGVEGCISPTDGYAFIAKTFSCPVYAGLYIVWLLALWFHLSHGFWSAFQTLGVNGKIWFNRWKVIGNVWVAVVILMFIAVVVAFATGLAGCCGNCGSAC
ncbi:MAG: succinate dehydrogenase/fumarate reductase cytochrome b subunit [Bacteroidaceae bacterium]|nr:succinate dehydrogenase/fumarate reductase cytochrome b subunit [Bacteroidaceae bacterium]